MNTFSIMTKHRVIQPATAPISPAGRMLTTSTRPPLQSILRAHGLWLENAATGRRADLSGMTLNDFDLVGVNLSQAILTGAALLDANLAAAHLSAARLERSDLRRPNLS